MVRLGAALSARAEAGSSGSSAQRLCRGHRRADFALEVVEIGLDHLADERVERDLVRPAELFARFGRIAQEDVDFGRPEIPRVDFDQDLAGPSMNALLLASAAAPYDLFADNRKGLFNQFPHRMGFTGRQHIIIGEGLLEHAPHALDIIPRMAPVALRIQIADIELVLKTQFDPRNPARDLAGDEGLAPDRALVIEEDTVRGMVP